LFDSYPSKINTKMRLIMKSVTISAQARFNDHRYSIRSCQVFKRQELI
jgi:hypothetical protein